MLGAIMRAAVNPKATQIWEVVYYAILKVVGNMEESGASKQRRKKREGSA